MDIDWGVMKFIKALFDKLLPEQDLRDWEDRFHNGYQISKCEYLKHIK